MALEPSFQRYADLDDCSFWKWKDGKGFGIRSKQQHAVSGLAATDLLIDIVPLFIERNHGFIGLSGASNLFEYLFPSYPIAL